MVAAQNHGEVGLRSPLRTLLTTLCHFPLTKSSSSPKSAKAVAHTQNHQPTTTLKIHQSSSSSSHPASSSPKKKKSRSRKGAPRQEEKSELQALDEFVETIIDPDKHLARYPLNKVETAVCRQNISFTGQSYSDDGSVNVYVTNDPEYPIAVSTLAAKTYNSGNHPNIVITQPVNSYGNVTQNIYAPLVIDNTLLFNAPVNFADGTTRPGYHLTVASAPLVFTVFHGPGLVGQFNSWWRKGDGTLGTASYSINSFAVSSSVPIAVNSTAFGFDYSFLQNTVDRFTIVVGPNTDAGFTIGNHASYATKRAIPDLNTMRARQARVIGLKTHVCFEGADLYNAGRIASAQFPPGVYPGMYAGRNAYEQIRNSRMKQSYWGRFDKGAVSRFVPPQEDSFLIGPDPKRFGEDGFIVMSWYSQAGEPQPYEVNVAVAIEFTTPSTAFETKLPHFSKLEFVNHSQRILAVMCMHTENPLHDLVRTLWDKLKGKAKEVVTSPGTWFTIADLASALLV